MGLIGGVPLAAPELPVAPAFPLETLPASATTAPSVEPAFESAGVTGAADDEMPAGSTDTAGARDAAGFAAVEDPPEPASVPVSPETDDAVAVPLEDAEPEGEPEAGVVPKAEPVAPEPAEPAPVDADPVDPAFDAQDPAAVTLPACGDPAAAAHWDDTGVLDPPSDAVASPVPPLAPAAPPVTAWPAELATVSAVVAASVAQAAAPAGTVAAEEHVVVATDSDAPSARAPGQTDQITRLAATNANHQATCFRCRTDVPAKAPLRRLLSISPSDAKVKTKQLAFSPTGQTRAQIAANRYLTTALPYSPKL
jgi:hypothetical protein